MIEMNMDCRPLIPELCEFFDESQTTAEEAYHEFFISSQNRWGGGTVEPAVAQLLYICVRLFNPRNVIEFGTNLGYSTYAIAAALWKNQSGYLDTYEINPDFIAEAKTMCREYQGRINFILGDTTQAVLEKTYDLAFIDSSHEYGPTVQEIKLLRENNPHMILLFHDALNPEVNRALKEQSGELLILPTQPNTGFGVLY